MKSENQHHRIIIPSTEKEFEMYYKLRYEVLRKPWNQPENTTRDEWENQSLHVLMLDDSGNPIATGRLQYNSETEGQVRSMAVIEKYRGQGIGTEVLKFIEEKAAEKKLSKIVLDARDNAVDFYLRNGYKVEGESYNLFDVIPHFKMSKVI